MLVRKAKGREIYSTTLYLLKNTSPKRTDLHSSNPSCSGSAVVRKIPAGPGWVNLLLKFSSPNTDAVCFQRYFCLYLNLPVTHRRLSLFKKTCLLLKQTLTKRKYAAHCVSWMDVKDPFSFPNCA